MKKSNRKSKGIFVSPTSLLPLLLAGVANLRITPPRPKRQRPQWLADELDTLAEEKRCRKNTERRMGYIWGIKNNPTLKNTGRNWVAREVWK